MYKVSPYKSSAGLLLFPFFICLLIFWLIPLMNGFHTSMQADKPQSFQEMAPDEGAFIFLDNYKQVFSDKTYYKALKNTFIYTLGSIAIILPLAFIFANLLLTSNKYLRPVFTFILIIPGLAPPVVLSILFLLFFHGDHGILNEYFAKPIISLCKGTGLSFFQSWPDFIDWHKDPRFIMWGLVIQSVWRWTGFITLFFLCALESIPKNYLEASSLDGANALQKTIYIKLPHCWNIIVFSSVYLFIDAFALSAGSFRLLGASGSTDNAGLLLVTYINQTHSVFHNSNLATAISMSIVPVLMFVVALVFIIPAICRKNQQELNNAI